jgi:hypothetical protein
MSLTLYDLSAPTSGQTTRAESAILSRATKHCAETGGNPDDVVCARLHPDIAPFHFQIESPSNHAVWGLKAVETGGGLHRLWRERTLAFKSETFLLSYALPNFSFHAVTAYDILRTRGVPVGKGDYEGRLRTSTPSVDFYSWSSQIMDILDVISSNAKTSR